jgi:hypothetical protein
MPAPRVQLEDLLALAETLRGAGFALGTQQYIAAHELLIALAVRGRLPADLQQWRTLLAQIFCSSPREQAEFAEHFAAWLQRRPQWQLAIEQPVTKLAPPLRRSALRRPLVRLTPGNVKVERQAWLSSPALWLTALAVVLLLTFRIVYLKSSAEPRPAVSPTVTPTAQPSPTTVPGVASDDGRWLLVAKQAIVRLLDLLGVAFANRRWLAVVPLLLYARWLLWRGWRRKLILQKLQTSGTPRLQQINLACDRVALFESPVFRRTLIELRRHQHSASGDLDVAATVRATIRQGGFFTPAYGWRRTLPEYLLLIDCASLHDEQAHLGAELADRLKASALSVDWFYFQAGAFCAQPDARRIGRALSRTPAAGLWRWGGVLRSIFGPGTALAGRVRAVDGTRHHHTGRACWVGLPRSHPGRTRFPALALERRGVRGLDHLARYRLETRATPAGRAAFSRLDYRTAQTLAGTRDAAASGSHAIAGPIAHVPR